MLCMVLLSAPPLQAQPAPAPTSVGPIALTIPTGFVPAYTQRKGKTLTSAWTRSARGSGTKALLQVTVHDQGSKLAAASAADLQVATEKHFRELIADIERRRGNFTQSQATQIIVAGAPALRATWNGKVGAFDMAGIVYCLVVTNRFVVTFQTQDLGQQPTSAMIEAMHAIESAQPVGGT